MTEDDPVLAQLVAIADEGQGSSSADPRYDALAEGTLSPEEILRLQKLAERSDEARHAYEVSRPLDEVTVERMLKQVMDEALEQEKDPVATTGTEALQSGVSPESAPSGPRRGRLMYIAPIIAAAAAIPFLALWPPHHPPLPQYEVGEVKTGTQETRGLSSGNQGAMSHQVTLGAGEHVSIAIQPFTNVKGPVELQTFIDCDSKVSFWDVTAKRWPSGSFTIRGRADDLFDKNLSGSCRLIFVIGPPDAFPTDPSAVAAALARPDEPFGERQLLTQKVAFGSDAP